MPGQSRQPPDWNIASTDEELVRRAQQGQLEAFGQLYDRHVSSIYGSCYRRLGEREAAQDATAETFRKALVALPTYRPGAFRAWLFAIARHVVVDSAWWRAVNEGALHRSLPLAPATEVTHAGPSGYP